MLSSFKITGLEHDQFDHLFGMSDEDLKAHGAMRCVATENPGFPCRISLEDAQIGDELLLLPFIHQPAASPYQASGPIFVRKGSKRHDSRPREVPSYVTSRLISVRAYDAANMMVAATVCEGLNTGREIEEFFGNAEVAYIHLHNAKRGCFSARVERA